MSKSDAQGLEKNIVQGLGMLLTFENVHTYKHVLMYVLADVNATE